MLLGKYTVQLVMKYTVRVLIKVHGRSLKYTAQLLNKYTVCPGRKVHAPAVCEVHGPLSQKYTDPLLGYTHAAWKVHGPAGDEVHGLYM
jgi:hypothetical protein